MKKLIAMLLALVMVFALVSCGSSSSSSEATSEEPAASAEEAAPAEDAAPAEEAAPAEASGDECDADLDYASANLSGLTIGYVTINSSAPWGGLVGTSFAEYAESCGATVRSLDAQTDADKVTEYAQQCIDAGVDALVIFGGDITANAEIAKTAYEAGVAVFMAGLDVAEEGRQYVAAVVGPDQYQMTADIAAYILDENGADAGLTVVQINGVPFLEDYIERCAGFQDYMAENGNYDLTIPAEDCYSDRTAAKTAMETWLTEYGDGIDIVMGYDDDLTMGAIQAIDEAGLTGQIKVYSLTGQNDAIQAVADGQLELTVVNRAQDIGAGLCTAIADYMENGSTTYYQRTPLQYVTAENVSSWIGNGEF